MLCTVWAVLLLMTALPVFATASEYATWNDVADAMDVVIDDAVAAYESGDKDTAAAGVKNAYYGYYETTGFERVTMGAISGARKKEVELQFSVCRSSIKKDADTETVRTECETLKAMLREDANRLDGKPADGGDASGENVTETSGTTGSGGAAYTFVTSFAIILREGLEAILIVGAIIAYLMKTGNQKSLRPVYFGSVFAIICSFIAAWILQLLKLANSDSQEIIEGVAALIAVCVLFYVSNWMVSKSESAAWSQYIEGKVAGSVETGSAFTLGFTAWLAVFREGAEVILFYQPMLAGGETHMVAAGFGLGCVCLVGVYLAIRLLSLRLPLKPFFLATSILMAVMSIAFLGGGLGELIEGGVIPISGRVSWIPFNDTLTTFGVYPYLETLIPQLILLAITVATFLIQMRRNRRIREEAAKNPPPAAA